MGRYRPQKSYREYDRKPHPIIAENEEWRSADANDRSAQPPNAIVNLQHTIGNQAVQRLINDDVQGENALVRRAPEAEAVAPAEASSTQQNETLPPAFASISLASQGPIQGESTAAGHEGQIEVLAFSIEDSDSGTIVKFTKPVDKSTATFLKALTSNEGVKSAQFELVHRNERGDPETSHTFQFVHGYVMGDQITSPNTLDSSSRSSHADVKELETVTLRFPKPGQDQREKDKK
jgi:type VI secretion system Hcp family effector